MLQSMSAKVLLSSGKRLIPFIEPLASESTQNLEVVICRGCVWLHVVELCRLKFCCVEEGDLSYGIELRHYQFRKIPILVKIAFQRRAVCFVVAVTAAYADMRTTLDGPACSVAVDCGTIVCEEAAQVL